MSRVAVIGEPVRVRGYALAGAEVHECVDGSAVRSAWAALTDDVAVVILSPAAAAVLDLAARAPSARPLTVVLPV
jgi:vacuolar-type H+-ATPase subunit F/Vma7